ncbi:translation initiation factor IF-2 [Microvirga sp. W0021]|uniref:Translation initiation factor IF-2 n=1 Tax=Hohaiivirga grylli TaxID=3133970 RepID=A0ABV0BIU2_9HYPH
MSDTKNPGDKTLHVSPKTLTMKRPVEQGVVRQSFSHGRSKAVVVETKKRRVIGPGSAPAAAPKDEKPVVQQTQAAPAPVKQAKRPADNAATGSLSDHERDARLAALADAKKQEEERQRLEREEQVQREKAAADAKKREEEEQARAAAEAAKASEAAKPAETAKPVEAAEKPAVAEKKPEPVKASAPEKTGGPSVVQSADAARRGGRDERRPMSLDHLARPAAPKEPEPAKSQPKPAAKPAAKPSTPPRSAAVRTLADDDESGRNARTPGKLTMPVKVPKSPGEDRRRGRLTVTNALNEGEERTRSVAAFRRRQQKMMGRGQQEPKEKLSREVTIPETITIQELANRMAERGVDVIKFLMKQGEMHKITDVIDADTAQLVAEELGHTVKRVAESDVEDGLFDTPDADDTLVARPPVVTIMGHVDHGKTSLLDALRKTNIVSGEAGGITQHIGAYQITSPLGGKITFIDTPGHAAFTAMRARGAGVTDIVVLVVAADDGVMPQTIEAISHAKAAGVPIIVAINKIDKPEANPDRVRTELLSHEVVVESMGGDTLEFEISAKTRQGLDTLLEGLTLQAEILQLKANPERAAEGTVIEAKLDRGRGPVATVLVQRGTLRTGDIAVAGSEWGRVRALISDKGDQVKEAGPSVPVEILGFNGTPEAGDRVAVVESEARAREITEYRTRQKRDRQAARLSSSGRSLVDMMREIKEGAGRKEFPLLIKADVQGSAEAIESALIKLGNEEVSARIIHTAVGGITESDVTLAEASNAIILGFNVRAHKEAREAAERAGVEIRYYNIIYDLVDDVKAAMSGLLAPTLREERLGEAQVLEVFNVSKVGKVAGCRVIDGVVQRGAHVRLIRDSVVIHEGKLSQLKRFKDDAREVTSGQECGMSFENYQDVRQGDFIECYRVEEIKRSL